MVIMHMPLDACTHGLQGPHEAVETTDWNYGKAPRKEHVTKQWNKEIISSS